MTGLQIAEAGRLPDGRLVHECRLTRGSIALRVMTWGVSITALQVPDREGRVADVVRGFGALGDYLAPHPWIGSVVGRYANRIAQGRFEIDGVAYQAPLNDGSNTLHGGPVGFGRRLWEISATEEGRPAGDGPAVTLRCTSADGEEGFPGSLEVRTTLSLEDGQRLCVDTEASSDRPTIVNLTRHDYFNLAGTGTILDHELMLPAGRFHPVDAALIPTGTAMVEATPFDFRSPRAIGERIGDAHPQLELAHGYDHHWILDEPPRVSPRMAARLRHPASGRRLTLWSTEPGLQFYAGQMLDGSLRSRAGEHLVRHAALCLEPQSSPDSPHHPEWPSTVLRPGETWRSRNIYAFDID